VGTAAGAYLAVGRQSFRRQASYRGAVAAGIFTNTVFGVILASVMLAVFRERHVIGGIDAADAVTLTFVAQGLLVVVATFGWRELTLRVRSGEVAVDLQRPLDPSWYWLSVFCGSSAFSMIGRGIPPFVAGMVVFRMTLPQHAVTWLWFALTVVGAAFVAARWWFCVSLSAFWFGGDVRGVIQLAATVQLFCSGSLVPLQFLPGGLAGVVRHSPFATLTQLPAETLLERQGPLGVLGAQLFWFVVLDVVGRLGWRLAARRLVIDGG